MRRVDEGKTAKSMWEIGHDQKRVVGVREVTHCDHLHLSQLTDTRSRKKRLLGGGRMVLRLLS